MRKCTTHHHACDCREREFAEVLKLASFVMERWATGEELHEFHVRCEKLVGTAYPLRFDNKHLTEQEPPE
jgi:hypothetical protein